MKFHAEDVLLPCDDLQHRMKWETFIADRTFSLQPITRERSSSRIRPVSGMEIRQTKNFYRLFSIEKLPNRKLTEKLLSEWYFKLLHEQQKYNNNHQLTFRVKCT